jgi:hypothetical protein
VEAKPRTRDGRIFVIGLAMIVFMNVLGAALSPPGEPRPRPAPPLPPAAPPVPAPRREAPPPPDPLPLPPVDRKPREEEPFPELLLYWAAMVAAGFDPMEGASLPICAFFPPVRL